MPTDRHTYGTWIAKLMAEKISSEEEMALDKWVDESDENQQLFDDLTNEHKAVWAQQWFREAGVKTRGIKWEKMDGWYRTDPNPLRTFYIGAAVAFVLMICIYLVLRYL